MASFDDQAVQQEELQRLLEARTLLDSQIHALSRGYSTRRTRTASVSHVRRQDVPRTASMSGIGMSRKESSNRSHHEAIQMVASSSHRSLPAMARLGSRIANHTTGPLKAFSPKDIMSPAIMTSAPFLDAPAIESWKNDNEDPYIFTHQGLILMPAESTGRANSQQYDFLDHIGEDPAEYVSRTSAVPLSWSPSGPSRTYRPNLMAHSRNHIPTTPSTTALTSGTTLASEMSRQSSLTNEAVLTNFDMMRMNSDTSVFDTSTCNDYYQTDDFMFEHQANPLSSTEEQNQLLAGAGGATFVNQLPSCLDSTSHLSRLDEAMIRSHSNGSASSTSSSQSRARLQLQSQIQLAARRIAPKAGSEVSKSSSELPEVPMVRITSQDGTGDKIVAAITKTPYQRPQHERISCNLCDDSKETFRGAHELKRHTDRMHKDTVTKWVCVEPANIANEFRPVRSFAKCKTCMTQKKRYGAYYNAAAHLRRAHFVPKARGRSKPNKTDSKKEKRGGKGGGDWPPMSELKRWMKEISEKVDPNDLALEDDDDVDEMANSYYDIGLSNMLAAETTQFENSRYDDRNDSELVEFSSTASYSAADMQHSAVTQDAAYDMSLLHGQAQLDMRLGLNFPYRDVAMLQDSQSYMAPQYEQPYESQTPSQHFNDNFSF